MTRRAPLLALAFAFVLAGCPDGDDQPPDLGFRVVLQDLDGVLLGFWGTSATDLFVVGGNLSTTTPAEIILWHDGTAWYRMEADAPTLWWAFGFGHDNVWAVGERGTIVHFDGTAWTTVETGADYTLWGVWGAAPDDVWTVGGSPIGNVPGAIRHWDGTAWSDATGVQTEGEMFFKVWGTASTDVTVVGDGGSILHWNGSAWTKLTSPTQERLTTVIGRGSTDLYAVGGVVSGVLVHGDGTSWSLVETPNLLEGLMGVWTKTGQDVLVTGFRGLVAYGDMDGFRVQRTVVDVDLHAAWSDGNGVFLAGGGDLFLPTPPRGAVIAAGNVAPGPVIPWPGP